jgi:hypothetical protein
MAMLARVMMEKNLPIITTDPSIIQIEYDDEYEYDDIVEIPSCFHVQLASQKKKRRSSSATDVD